MAEPKQKRTSTHSGNLRLLLLGSMIFLWMFVIAGRLVALQIFRYGEFTQRAMRQQQRTVEVAPRRGVIYDRNGHELAMTISVDSVFAVPSEMPDQANVATLLARVLHSDPRELLERLQTSRNFVWIARKVDGDISDRIRAMNLRGIYFQKESKRFYPKREMAAQVLGYVGTDDEGLGGIERSFNQKLEGKPGKMLISVDARQRSLGRVEKQPDPGSNVVLTIDEQIQYIAEKELDKAVQDSHAESGTIVVQNPHTGEILALASRPTFNPNLFRTVSPQQLNDRAVSDIYEPGSTFKIVTLSAALEEKLARPDELVDCQMGSITIFGHKIHDHKAYGELTVSQILQNSSDVGAIKMGLRLGDQRLDHYIRAYGFGAQTGIELPGETRGIAKPVNRWSKISIGAISMGQEVGVSALQAASMVSAVANDGVYTPPRIVAGVIAPRETPQTISFQKPPQHRVISPMTAAEMKQMLADTVLFGTGKKAILDGYTSAGKTGTAQKADPRTHRYSKTNYVASFAGFAPVNQPAVTIYVVIDSPHVGSHEGGLAAAPVFARVAQQTLAYLNVAHDTDVRDPRLQMLRASAKPSDLSEGSPDHLSDEDFAEDPTAADANTSGAGSQPTQTGPVGYPAGAKVVAASFTPAVPASAGRKNSMDQTSGAQSPVAQFSDRLSSQTGGRDLPAPTNGTVVVDTGSGALAPSVLGKTLRSALETAEQAGVEMEVVGSGIAREQFPAPGQPMASGSHLVVRFSR